MNLYDPSKFGDVTIPEVIALYLDHLSQRVQAGQFSAEGFSNMERELTWFAQAHKFSVLDAKQHDLTRWLNSHPQWASAHTKKRIIANIITAFRWGVEEEIIERCPYRRIKSITQLPYEPRRPAEAREYVALMRNGHRCLRRALFFLRRTGCRTCEMRELLWTDCQLDGIPPCICLFRHKTLRQTGRPRRIGLDPSTARFLLALRRQSQSEYVFGNCYGNPWTRRSFGQQLRRLAKNIGLDDGVESKVTAYCLRHAYAVNGIRAGVTTRKLADQMGHETTVLIDRVYGRHTREQASHLADVAKEAIQKRRRE